MWVKALWRRRRTMKTKTRSMQKDTECSVVSLWLLASARGLHLACCKWMKLNGLLENILTLQLSSVDPYSAMSVECSAVDRCLALAAGKNISTSFIKKKEFPRVCC